METVGYRRTYRLRCAVPNAKSIEVTFPYEVVEREATIHGMTVQEFIQQFEALAEYNSFEGVRYTFKRREDAPDAPKAVD